jgi:serine/threonine protein kinase
VAHGLLLPKDMQSAKNFWPGSDAAKTERKGGERRTTGTSTPSLPDLPSHLVVQRVLGEGGTSTVYRALHMRLKVPVAIKVLARLEEHEDEARERLLREAELCARLSDSRFPRIYDVDTLPDGTPYIVMEYIAGRNLAELIACGPLEVDTACAITREVLEALIDIHEIGIIHRDIKPANIILEESPGRAPRVRVVDFGIAKTVTPHRAWQPLTQQGAMVGTPHYMAPEQIRGQELDVRVDLYAVGALLYELLSGRPAFSGNTLGEVIAATLRDQPTRLTEICEVSPELEAFVMKAMSRDRQQRFETAVDMLAALHEVQYIGARDEEVPNGPPTLDNVPFDSLPFADEARSGLLPVARSQRPSLLIVPDPEWLENAPDAPIATPLRNTVNRPARSRRGWKLMYACVAAGALAAIVWPTQLSDPGPVRPLNLAGSEAIPSPAASVDFGSAAGSASQASAPETAATPQALTTPPVSEPGPEPIVIMPSVPEHEARETERRSERKSARARQPADPSSQMLRRYLSELEKLSVPAPPAQRVERNDDAETRSDETRNRDGAPQRDKPSVSALPANPY